MAQATASCVNHPERTTRVRCCACDRPICTGCMRETPVGMKCRDCARQSMHARGLGKPRHYATAIGAGLGAAVALGALAVLAGLGLFGIIFPLVAGFAVGRVVAWGAKGHRHSGFQAIAAGTTVVGLVAGEALAAARPLHAIIGPSLLGLVIAAVTAAIVAGR